MSADCTFKKIDNVLLSRLTSTQWRERSDALDTLERHLQTSGFPKSGNYNPIVVAVLEVVSKDKHQMLVIRGASIIQQLARTLGKQYTSFAERSLSVCLSRLKETRLTVLQALRSAGSALLHVMPLEAAIDQLSSPLTSSSPNVLTETAQLLAYCLRIHNPRLSAGRQVTFAQRIKLTEPLLTLLAKLSQHRCGECREASIKALAASQLFLDVDDDRFAALTENLLDDNRRNRVHLAYGLLKIELEADISSSKLKTPKSSARRRQPKTGSSSRRQNSLNASPPITRSSDKYNKPPKARTESKGAHRPLRDGSQKHQLNDGRSEPHSVVRNSSARKLRADKQAISANTSVQKKIGNAIVKDLSTYIQISDAECLNELTSFYRSVPLDQLSHVNWKLRLNSVERLGSCISQGSLGSRQIALTLHFLLQSGRLKDSTLQVRSNSLDVCNRLLSMACVPGHKLGDRLTSALFEQLISLLADHKAGALVKKALDSIVFGTAPQAHSSELQLLLGIVPKQSKPTILAPILDWLSSLFERTLSLFDCSSLVVQVLRHVLVSRYPNVRNSAILLTGSVYVCMHCDAQLLLNQLAVDKPSLVTRLEEEFSRRRSPSIQRSQSSRKGDTIGTDDDDNIIANTTVPVTGNHFLMQSQIAECHFSSDDDDDDLQDDQDRARTSVRTPIRGLIQPFSQSMVKTPIISKQQLQQPPTLYGQKKQPIEEPLQPVAVYQPDSSATQNMFFSDHNQTMAKLLEAKSARLKRLSNKVIFTDLTQLVQLFHDARATPELMSYLFSPGVDARLECVDRLLVLLEQEWMVEQQQQPSSSPSLTSGVYITHVHFDLFLTWTVLTCFSYSLVMPTCQVPSNELPSNTDYHALIHRGIQYVTAVVCNFAQANLRLCEQEVNLLLQNLLCGKPPSLLRDGGPGSPVQHLDIRNSICSLISLLRQVYPASLLFNNLAEVMHDSASSALRQLCLQELSPLISRFVAFNGFNFHVSLKLIALRLSDPDSGVNRSALECLRLAYGHLGQRIWEMIGNLPSEGIQRLQNYLKDPGSSSVGSNPTAEDCMTPHQTCYSERRLRAIERQSGTKISSSHLATFVEMGGSPSLRGNTGDVVTAKHSANLPTDLRSHRCYSPPPVHKSPAAPSLLLPLISVRNSSTASESDRTQAAKELDCALSCLVDQLSGHLYESVSTIPDVFRDDGSVVVSKRQEMDFDTDDSGAYSASHLNNVLLGALVDLESLIRDPRTCDILLPFINPIVCRLASLAQSLTKSPCNAGRTLFTNCLVGELLAIFKQPFLAREVSVANCVLLLRSLFQLAHRDAGFGSNWTVNSDVEHLCPDQRRGILLKLIHVILDSIAPTFAFSALISILHVYFTTVCTNAQNPSAVVVLECQENLNDPNDDLTESPLVLDLIRRAVLGQLWNRTNRLSDYGHQLNWTVLLPVMEQLLSLPSPSSCSAQQVQSEQESTWNKLELCIRRLLVSTYALIGPSFIDQATGCLDANSVLVTYLKHLSSLSPNAPYAHCQPECNIVR